LGEVSFPLRVYGVSRIYLVQKIDHAYGKRLDMSGFVEFFHWRNLADIVRSDPILGKCSLGLGRQEVQCTELKNQIA
jgi:hypothetical protein